MSKSNHSTTIHRTLRALVALAVFGLMLGLAADGRRAPWQGPDQGRESARLEAAADARLVAPALAAGNQPPVAEAGFDRTVAIGDTVVLDGSDSIEPEGAKVSYAWQLVSVPAGSAAALDDPTSVKPAFTADQAGDYTIQLIVTEGPRSSPRAPR